MGVVNQAVQDGIGHGGVGDSVVPVFDWELGGGEASKRWIFSIPTILILMGSPDYLDFFILGNEGVAGNKVHRVLQCCGNNESIAGIVM